MLVIGAGKFRERLNPYLGLLLRAHVAFSVAGVLGLGVAAAVLFALASTNPAVLLVFLAGAGGYRQANARWCRLQHMEV